MPRYLLVVLILSIEIAVFFAEVFLSSLNTKNRRLASVSKLEDLDFVDLEKGYRTNISVFRISTFVAYVILVILLIDTSTAENPIEELILYIIIGILIFMISLMNLKVFSFYSSYFVIGSPFRFLTRDKIIHYEDIKDFHLYRALYNSYYLRLKFKSSPDETIQFSAAYLPRNDLVLQIILNSKSGLNKDFQEMGEEDDFS